MVVLPNNQRALEPGTRDQSCLGFLAFLLCLKLGAGGWSFQTFKMRSDRVIAKPPWAALSCLGLLGIGALQASPNLNFFGLSPCDLW